MKILSKNQYLILEQYKIGDKFYSTDIKKYIKLNTHNGVGGIVSALYRNGYIEPIWRENRVVFWKRVK